MFLPLNGRIRHFPFQDTIEANWQLHSYKPSSTPATISQLALSANIESIYSSASQSLIIQGSTTVGSWSGIQLSVSCWQVKARTEFESVKKFLFNGCLSRKCYHCTEEFPPKSWGARCRWWMQQWGPEGQKSERACNWFRRQSPHPSTTWEIKGQGNKCCQRQTHSNYTTTGPEHGFYFFCSEENSGGKNQPFVILCLRRALSFWMGEGGEESPSTAECR